MNVLSQQRFRRSGMFLRLDRKLGNIQISERQICVRPGKTPMEIAKDDAREGNATDEVVQGRRIERNRAFAPDMT